MCLQLLDRFAHQKKNLGAVLDAVAKVLTDTVDLDLLFTCVDTLQVFCFVCFSVVGSKVLLGEFFGSNLRLPSSQSCRLAGVLLVIIVMLTSGNCLKARAERLMEQTLAEMCSSFLPLADGVLKKKSTASLDSAVQVLIIARLFTFLNNK